VIKVWRLKKRWNAAIQLGPLTGIGHFVPLLDELLGSQQREHGGLRERKVSSCILPEIAAASTHDV
jgi:hypothetical protein